MKILLHICCAPCSIHPFSELLKEGGNSITGFFYNPNIHPAEELEKRRDAVSAYSKNEDFDVIFGEYEPDKFFKETSDHAEAPGRCSICWRMRLRKTAEHAKRGRYDAFTTTLLVSPYQDREEIIKIGSECGKEFGVDFIASDFRGGFRKAQDEAREHGIYRQKYCGCIYSQKEAKDRQAAK